MSKIALIGGGNMGEAILKGTRHKYSIAVSEKSTKRRAYLKRKYKVRLGGIKEVCARSSVIVLAVKPQDIDAALKEMAAVIKKNQVVISIAAGITTAYIEKSLRGKTRVVRTMPNMPALVHEGITAIAKGRYAKKSDLALARRIFDSLGETVIVKENLINAVTAVSGSGPGYVFLFVECLMKAARSTGLSKDLAEKLVLKTFSGSIHLLEKQKADAGTLRAKVTSKGGTTQAAMDVFMKAHIDQIIKKAVGAAKKRAARLASKKPACRQAGR